MKSKPTTPLTFPTSSLRPRDHKKIENAQNIVDSSYIKLSDETT